MSASDAPLALWATVDPPVASVADPEVDFAVLLSMESRPRNGEPRRGAPVHLAVMLVGPPKPGAAGTLQHVLDTVMSKMRPMDRLSLAHGITAQMGDREGRELLRRRVPEAAATAFPTMAAALDAGRDALADTPRPQTACRLFVIVTAPVIEQLEQLSAATARLEEAHIGFDVFATSSAVDLGLLIRLANVSGGEVVMARDADELGATMLRRGRQIQGQWAVDCRIELEFTPGVQPGQMFRVSPSPVFLGNVRLTPTDRTLIIDPGPIVSGQEPNFLLTATVPRRQVGNYRLIETRIRPTGEASHLDWVGAVTQRCSSDPMEVSSVEAAVMCLRDRVEPLAWVEEAARAQADAEHRRVSVTLDRMLRRFLELKREEEAGLVGDIRGRYLRSGVLDRVELNRLRYAAGLGATSI